MLWINDNFLFDLNFNYNFDTSKNHKIKPQSSAKILRILNTQTIFIDFQGCIMDESLIIL